MAEQPKNFNSWLGNNANVLNFGQGVLGNVANLVLYGLQRRDSAEAATTAYQRQQALIDKMNQYNSPRSQLERLKSAGLNPNAVLGDQGLESGQTALGSSPMGSVAATPNLLMGEIGTQQAENDLANSQREINTKQLGLIAQEIESAKEVLRGLTYENQKKELEACIAKWHRLQIGDITDSEVIPIERSYAYWYLHANGMYQKYGLDQRNTAVNEQNARTNAKNATTSRLQYNLAKDRYNEIDLPTSRSYLHRYDLETPLVIKALNAEIRLKKQQINLNLPEEMLRKVEVDAFNSGSFLEREGGLFWHFFKNSLLDGGALGNSAFMRLAK